MNFATDENLKKLFLAKENKGLSFQQLGDAIGKNEVWISALFHGQAMVKEVTQLTARQQKKRQLKY